MSEAEQTIDEQIDSRPADKSPLARIATRHGVQPSRLIAVIQQTIIKDRNVSDEEVLAFLMVADRYGLDPILKQIHAFRARGGGLVPIVGVDGWARIASQEPLCDGYTFKYAYKPDGSILSCTCVMGVKGRAIPTEITEFYDECFRPTDAWKQMGHRMIRHRAFVQACRVVLGVSGLYDPEEGEDIATGVIGGAPSEGEQQRDRLKAILDQRQPPAEQQATPQPQTEAPATPPAEQWQPVKVSVVERVNRKGGAFVRWRVVLEDGTELKSESEDHFPALDFAQQGMATEMLIEDGTIKGVRNP